MHHSKNPKLSSHASGFDKCRVLKRHFNSCEFKPLLKYVWIGLSNHRFKMKTRHRLRSFLRPYYFFFLLKSRVIKKNKKLWVSGFFTISMSKLPLYMFPDYWLLLRLIKAAKSLLGQRSPLWCAKKIYSHMLCCWTALSGLPSGLRLWQAQTNRTPDLISDLHKRPAGCGLSA